MKKLCVLQHTEAEYLGLMEDHFEGRNIRFVYKRPFTSGGTIPAGVEDYDGLILLGGGPYGLVSGHLLPSFMPELRLTKAFLDAGLPVIGIELGALILANAAGGGAEEAPLRFSIETVAATPAGQSLFTWPQRFATASYLRDRPCLPPAADPLAIDSAGNPVAFRVGDNCLGMTFHPGAKRGMLEDLIMEFDDTPADTAQSLAALGTAQSSIAETVSAMMSGLCRLTGLV